MASPRSLRTSPRTAPGPPIAHRPDFSCVSECLSWRPSYQRSVLCRRRRSLAHHGRRGQTAACACRELEAFTLGELEVDPFPLTQQ